MGPGASRLQELKKRLHEMYGRSFRATPGVFRVDYTDGPDGDFFVTFHYRDRQGRPQLFRRHFDKHHVFGDSCRSANQNDWTYRMRLCRFGQDTIDALLTAMHL